LPKHLASDDSDPAAKALELANIDPIDAEEYSAGMDKDVLINSKYSMAMATAHQVIFFSKVVRDKSLLTKANILFSVFDCVFKEMRIKK